MAKRKGAKPAGKQIKNGTPSPNPMKKGKPVAMPTKKSKVAIDSLNVAAYVAGIRIAQASILYGQRGRPELIPSPQLIPATNRLKVAFDSLCDAMNAKDDLRRRGEDCIKSCWQAAFGDEDFSDVCQTCRPLLISLHDIIHEIVKNQTPKDWLVLGFEIANGEYRDASGRPRFGPAAPGPDKSDTAKLPGPEWHVNRAKIDGILQRLGLVWEQVYTPTADLTAEETPFDELPENFAGWSNIEVGIKRILQISPIAPIVRSTPKTRFKAPECTKCGGATRVISKVNNKRYLKCKVCKRRSTKVESAVEEPSQ